jgi:hypothetical protein
MEKHCAAGRFHNRRMSRRAWMFEAMGMVAVACSPTLDWREVRPESAELSLMFPCRPESHERRVVLGARPVGMVVLACRAGGATYALSHADVLDPAQVNPVLSELEAIGVANVAGASRRLGEVRVPGMTPNANAAHLLIEGTAPSGGALRVESAFFAHGTRVFQASIVGDSLDAAAVDTFLSSLKFGG